jgi:hypothetical protein
LALANGNPGLVATVQLPIAKARTQLSCCASSAGAARCAIFYRCCVASGGGVSSSRGSEICPSRNKNNDRKTA